jgi:hypothetical protein
MKTETPLQPLIVQADPRWAGKHPYHDARFVTTNHLLVTEHGEDGLAVHFREEDVPQAGIICQMRDCENQARYARLFAASPELLASLENAESYLSARNLGEGANVLLVNIKAALSKARGE